MKTRVFYNSRLARLLLGDGFSSLMFFGVVLTKSESLSSSSLNHETIHVRQFWETLMAGAVVWAFLAGAVSVWMLLGIPFTFYLLYGVECAVSWLWHVVKGDTGKESSGKAYRGSALEMEAYAFERDPKYLTVRRPFAFVKFYGTV